MNLQNIVESGYILYKIIDHLLMSRKEGKRYILWNFKDTKISFVLCWDLKGLIEYHLIYTIITTTEPGS